MAHIDIDTGAPIPGIFEAHWPDKYHLVYYTGDCFELWNQVAEGDNVYELERELTEDEALRMCV